MNPSSIKLNVDLDRTSEVPRSSTPLMDVSIEMEEYRIEIENAMREGLPLPNTNKNEEMIDLITQEEVIDLITQESIPVIQDSPDSPSESMIQIPREANYSDNSPEVTNILKTPPPSPVIKKKKNILRKTMPNPPRRHLLAKIDFLRKRVEMLEARNEKLKNIIVDFTKLF